jgi:predicted RND superfamily exporter protein
MTKRSARYVLLFLSLFTLLFGYYSFQVRVDYEFEDFFPSGSEEVAYFNDFRNNFETDNDFIMVAIENPDGVFDSLFLSQIKSLNKDLRKLDYVVEVSDLTVLKRVRREPITGKFIPNSVLRVHTKNSLIKDSIKIYRDPMLVPGFISEDGKHLNIIIKHDERLSKRKCDILNKSVDQALSKYNFSGYHKVGRSVAQSFYIDLMAHELLKFTLIGAFLVILFLYLTYRNAWSVIVPLVIVIVSAIWTIGFMTMIGKPLDIMLIVLPTILFIVGISDVIHLYTKFLFLKREGMEKTQAIKKTMNDVGLATLLTSVTTAIGFATLYFIGIPIIREFGLIMAFGVLITFFVTFLAFSAFLTLSPERNFSKVVQSDFWKNKLSNAFVFTIRNGKVIIIITVIFIGISLLGLNKIVQKNKLLEDLPKNSELLLELEFFDSTIVGLRPFEMGLKIKDPNKSLFDRDILLKIDLLDSFLLDNYAIKQLISPAMLIKKINFDLHRSNPVYFRIPDQAGLNIIVDEVNNKRFQENMEIYIDQDRGMARITGRIADFGSEYFENKNVALDSFYINNKFDEIFEYQVTGSASLIDLSNAMLSYNLLLGLIVAFGLIALISGLVFKSFKLVLVVLIVNIIPLLGVAGIMGFMGIDLKISTSVIFTIAYGIAVDDSIHFMSKFRIEYRNGKPLLYALKRTYFSTGRAIVLTTFVLIGGFISLIFSSFMGTYYIGLLVSSTLLLALIADLYLLPYLVFISLRNKNNTMDKA